MQGAIQVLDFTFYLRTGDGLMKCLLYQVLISTDVGEDAECHAAKLLEVVLLQFKGSIDHVSTHSLFVMLLLSGRVLTACLSAVT